MEFAALIPVFSALLQRIFPDPSVAAAAQNELQLNLNAAQIESDKASATQEQAQAAVIVAEASSQSYAARNWRPHLMYMLMLVVGYNFVLTPILRIFTSVIPVIPLPSELWTLLSIGLGGYIGKDALAHYSESKFNNQKYLQAATALFPKGMTQAQIDILNKAEAAGAVL